MIDTIDTIDTGHRHREPRVLSDEDDVAVLHLGRRRRVRGAVPRLGPTRRSRPATADRRSAELVFHSSRGVDCLAVPVLEAASRWL